jgi:hypothetical protein
MSETVVEWFPPRSRVIRDAMLRQILDLCNEGLCTIWGDMVDGREVYVVTLLEVAELNSRQAYALNYFRRWERDALAQVLR